MPLIAVTQRVEVIEHPSGRTERRDALDQAWTAFLAAVGCVPVLMPNHAPTALGLFDDLPIAGLLLTGGNDLMTCGGDAPERDATEMALLGAARALKMPVIGVCRGMQLLQQAFGVKLEPIQGHVISHQTIRIGDQPHRVNAFHRWGARITSPDLAVWAQSEDEVVKAVRHVNERLVGIMWHPERITPFAERDVALFRQSFTRRWECAA